MSELINNSEQRKQLLKHMIRELHSGTAPAEVRSRLEHLLGGIPYGEVVEVEQELIAEGISQEEIQQFCDIHTAVLDGQIDHSMARLVPPGHPVDTFQKENEALARVTARIMQLSEGVDHLPPEQVGERVLQFRALFNELGDVDKHYRRKENLLFPFLEQRGITGPPTVMWGKHDEIRVLLKSARETLAASPDADAAELDALSVRLLIPAARGVDDMIMKEEQILLPMCMDQLTELEWYEIHRQTPEIGFCLFDPQIDWRPKNVEVAPATQVAGDAVRMPSGALTPAELTAILNTAPFDMTFVDAQDKVKYFTQGTERIFDRNRTILGRDVRMCHPPSSVNIVDRILEDFKSGREERAPFWIQLNGKFIHIEYFAVRDPQGTYLGTLEVSQDLTPKRALEGEQRLLSYGEKSEADVNVPGDAVFPITSGVSRPEPAKAATLTAEQAIAEYGAHARIPAGSPPPAGHVPPATREPRPDWAEDSAIAARIDATALLDMGASPMNAVHKGLGGVGSGAIIHLCVSFYPTPMVDALRELGHGVWGEEIADGWAIWIRKR
ncbi:MAG: DUF438 domain-containing protein [Bacteroidetes bacterium]|nr:DUF438 domain-containing protein [Bacteroidota bacterium]